MALPTPPSPSNPIPNTPFYSPVEYALTGPSGPLVVGTGLQVSSAGVISATGGGGGAVSSIIAGSGISVSSSTGNVIISNTGIVSVAAGAGINVTGTGGIITISAIGQGTVSSVGVGYGLEVAGGPNPITQSGVINLADSGVVAGSYSYPQLQVDAKGRITSIGSQTALQAISGVGAISITPGSNPVVSVDSATITNQGVVQLSNLVDSASTTLAATAFAVKSAYDTAAAAIPKACLIGKGSLVTATSLATPSTLAIGSNGQVLVADSTCANGLRWSDDAGGSVTEVATGVGLTGGPITTTGTIALTNTAVIPGSYTGTNLTVDAQGRITAAENGVVCLGTLTNVNTGIGLTGGPITTTGTIALADTAVTPGSYTVANFTVDAQGRITAAENGTVCLGTVAQVNTGTGLTGGPITTTGTIALANTAVTPGNYFGANLTVDAQGRITAAENGTVCLGTVTEVNTGAGLSGGPISSTGTIALTDTGVVQGAYNSANITIDAQGRITSAANGTICLGTVTQVSTGTGLTGGPISQTGTISLSDTAVTPGTYDNASITVDAQGRLTSANTGTAPVTTVTGSAPIQVTAGATPVVSITTASTTDLGAVELSTNEETQAGTATTVVVTPASLQSKLSDSISTTSTTTIASSTAVKTAYDLANAAIPKSLLLGKGSLITANAFGVPVNLAAGSNGLYLKTDPASPEGLSWEAAGSVSSVATGAGLTGGPITTTGTISLASSGVAAGTYNFATVTVDIYGRVTLASSGSDATASTKGIVQVGTNIDVAAGVISVASATTSNAGIVQLDDTTSSNSVTRALTAAQGKSLQDQINALVISSNLTFAGTIDASTGLMVTVSSSTGGFVVGQPLPAPDNQNDQHFVIVTVPGTMTPPGGSPQECHQGDWWLSNGTIWEFLDVGFNAPLATTLIPGVVQLATDAEVQAGSNTDHAVTSSGLQSKVSDSISTTSSTVLASSTAVQTAYDKAVEALTFAETLGITSNTVIYVNTTDGSDLTGVRGTTRAFKTVTAALAAAQENDTLFLSPGTYVENVTLTKGVSITGTMYDQALGAGTKIQGNFVVNATATMTKNWTIDHVYFISTNSSPAFSIIDNSFVAGGTGNVWNCDFTQQSATDPTHYGVTTSGNWTRSVYFRDCFFDGNFHHNAGSAAGGGGYIVIDRLLGSGNPQYYNRITTGTVEFRNPSNTLAPVYQTGGVSIINGATSGIASSNATLDSVFGASGFSYKGSSALVGRGRINFQSGTEITGKVDIGDNMIYGFSNLFINPADLTVSGSAVPYTSFPPVENVECLSQQRPRLERLKNVSTVAAENQLAMVVDSTTGSVYTVSALDAGVY